MAVSRCRRRLYPRRIRLPCDPLVEEVRPPHILFGNDEIPTEPKGPAYHVLNQGAEFSSHPRFFAGQEALTIEWLTWLAPLNGLA